MKTLTVALVALAAGVPGAPAQAQRNEFAVQVAPAGLATDGRRLRAVSWDLDVQNGWWVGASLGYGNILKADEDDGVYGVVRLRHRFEPLPGLAWVQPQFGVEYGGTTNLFDKVDLLGAYGGVYLVMSPQLGFTVDLWTGRGRFKDRDLLGADVNASRSMTYARVSLSFKY
jgi:hypothetical protein